MALMNMRKEIGLVGCGRWGKNILRDLVALNVKVHVAEQNEKHRIFATSNGATEVYENHKALPELDGYIVACQTSSHYTVILDLLSFGKPIYSEKPLTNSLEDTQHLVNLALDQVFVMHKWRYHPGIQKMAEIAESLEYGAVLHLDIERKQFGIPHRDVDASFILTPHDLSIALHILGNLPKLNSAYGNFDSQQNIHYLNLHLGGSPSCKIEISDRFATTSRRVHIQMENASIFLENALSKNIIIKPLDAEEFSIAIDLEYPLIKELRSFLAYLERAEKTPMSSLTEELQIMSILDEARNQVFNSL